MDFDAAERSGVENGHGSVGIAEEFRIIHAVSPQVSTRFCEFAARLSEKGFACRHEAEPSGRNDLAQLEAPLPSVPARDLARDLLDGETFLVHGHQLADIGRGFRLNGWPYIAHEPDIFGVQSLVDEVLQRALERCELFALRWVI